MRCANVCHFQLLDAQRAFNDTMQGYIEARAEYLTLRSLDPALAEKLCPSFPEQKK